jgi:hypothetical protein
MLKREEFSSGCSRTDFVISRPSVGNNGCYLQEDNVHKYSSATCIDDIV